MTDWTYRREELMIQSPFAGLFDERELEAACTRLEQFGYSAASTS